MKELTDDRIIQELQDRFLEKNRLLSEQKQFADEIKQVNEKLVRSEEVKSHFLSNIKNEVNNPMASILGLLSLNLKKSFDEKKIVSNTKLIYQEVLALNFQLQNIFIAAELEAGETNLDLTKFSCGDVIIEVLGSFENNIEDKGLEVNVDITETDEIICDRSKLQLVVSNLISNALKFSSDGKSVEIKLVRNGSDMIFSFRDYGVGISNSDLSNIYDRFEQLNTGTTKSHGGHGLGLSIVHSLVDLMEGSLTVQSNGMEGTRVDLTIPTERDLIFEDIFASLDENTFFENGENEQVF
ncbi:MAG: HAMP domain-containing histidine kinase [Cytophagales bacterium]|nr:HAMP domain-containing histidine kinase [Cytophagales bacterium]